MKKYLNEDLIKIIISLSCERKVSKIVVNQT